jgi:hypothetical protein
MLKLGKGWRKWLMIGFLAILGGLAILAFTTGCSGDKPATTTTPLQVLQTDVAAVKARLDTLDDSVFQNSNSLSVLETWKTGIETWKASVNEQITTLQTGGTSPDVTGNITSIEARLTFLEMQWEGMVNPTPTPTATPSGSPTATPTPIPTATPICSVTKPANPYPTDGATGISDNNIELKWSDCHASNYMLYVGVNSSTSTILVYNGAYTRYYYDDLKPNTYYYWKVIAIAPLGCPDLDATWSFRTAP